MSGAAQELDRGPDHAGLARESARPRTHGSVATCSWWIAWGIGMCLAGSAAAQNEAQMAAAREQMVRHVILGGGITNPGVVEAMRMTPRHLFVAPQHRPRAYLDMALPIGDQQTISSPYIVAFMT